MVGVGRQTSVKSLDVAPLVVLILGGLWQWVGRPETVVNLHPFRQTQTLWPIREYIEGGWSLASPMPVLGPPWNVPFEFPLFQLVTAGLGSAVGLEAEPAARLISLAFFLLAGLALLYIVRAWFGAMAALVATALFVFSPFANQWAAATLMEYVPVALILSAIALVVRQRGSGRGYWAVIALAATLMTLAAMVKITTVVPWAPVMMVALGIELLPHQWRRLVTSLIILFLPAGVMTFVWTRYADGIKGQSELTVWLQSGNLPDWNFGTLSQRLVVDNTATILDRMSSLGAPLVVWILALVIGGVAYRWSWRFIVFAVVPFIAFLVFFNLYIIHDYYLAAVSPSYAAVVGIGVGAVAGRITDRRAGIGFIFVSIPLLLASSLLSMEGKRLAQVWRTPSGIPVLSQTIAKATDPDDVVLIVGCDWDPTVLYYANRRGIAVPLSWEGALPAASLESVTYVAGCTGLYEPSTRLVGDVVPEAWDLELVEPGVWRVVSK